jgi:hypothetical protein
MKFTPERRDIRDRAGELRGRLAEAEAELEAARAALHSLCYDECKHPAKKSRRFGPVRLNWCPDCGWSHP